MGRIGTLFFGIVLGAGLMYGAQRYHVLRASDGFYVIPKMNATFSEAYVDVRSFGFSDWAQHTSLAAAIIKAKKDHLLKDSATAELQTSLRSAIDGFAGR